MYKINRNDKCPCGSGKKYKKCCSQNEAKKNEIERACKLSTTKDEFLKIFNEEIMVYVLKISLNFIGGEPIENLSRTIEITADNTLYDLHCIIQNIFDWDNDHMFSFFMSNQLWDDTTEYSGNPLGEFTPNTLYPFQKDLSRSASETELRDLNLKANTEIKYVFDYGAQLIHTIQVLKLKQKNKKSEL